MTLSNSPIFQAAWQRRFRLTRLLLEGGTDVNAVNENGETALLLSILSTHESEYSYDRVGYIQLLLDNGADPDVQKRSCGRTALHIACQSAAPWAGKVVIALLRSRANPMIRSLSNMLPIHEAIRTGHQEDVLQELKRLTKTPLALTYSAPSARVRKKAAVQSQCFSEMKPSGRTTLRRQHTEHNLHESKGFQKEKQFQEGCDVSEDKRTARNRRPLSLSLSGSLTAPSSRRMKEKLILPPLDPKGSPVTYTPSPEPSLDLNFSRMHFTKSEIDLQQISLDVL